MPDSPPSPTRRGRLPPPVPIVPVRIGRRSSNTMSLHKAVTTRRMSRPNLMDTDAIAEEDVHPSEKDLGRSASPPHRRMEHEPVSMARQFPAAQGPGPQTAAFGMMRSGGLEVTYGRQGTSFSSDTTVSPNLENGHWLGRLSKASIASSTSNYSDTSSSIKSFSALRRASSIAMHELDMRPSLAQRPLSPHQLLLLTPFGNPVPAPAAGMVRSSVVMGPPAPVQGRMSQPTIMPGRGRVRSAAPIRRGSALGMSSYSVKSIAPWDRRRESDETSDIGNEDDQLVDNELSSAPVMAVAVPMTRSLSMPILTLREVEAMREKEAELGIKRNEGWAWVSGQENMHAGQSRSNGNFLTRPASPEAPMKFAQRQSINPCTPGPAPIFSDPFRRPSVSTSPVSLLGKVSVELPGRRASTASVFSDVSDAESPKGGVIPQRPRLSRYKTSPASLDSEAFRRASAASSVGTSAGERLFEMDTSGAVTPVSGGEGSQSPESRTARKVSDYLSLPKRGSTKSSSSEEYLGRAARLATFDEPTRTLGKAFEAADFISARRGSWASIQLVDGREVLGSLDASPLSIGLGRFSHSRSSAQSGEPELARVSRLASLDGGQDQLMLDNFYPDPLAEHLEINARRSSWHATNLNMRGGKRKSSGDSVGSMGKAAAAASARIAEAVEAGKKAWYERRGSWAEH